MGHPLTRCLDSFILFLYLTVLPVQFTRMSCIASVDGVGFLEYPKLYRMASPILECLKLYRTASPIPSTCRAAKGPAIA